MFPPKGGRCTAALTRSWLQSKNSKGWVFDKLFYSVYINILRWVGCWCWCTVSKRALLRRQMSPTFFIQTRLEIQLNYSLFERQLSVWKRKFIQPEFMSCYCVEISVYLLSNAWLIFYFRSSNIFFYRQNTAKMYNLTNCSFLSCPMGIFGLVPCRSIHCKGIYWQSTLLLSRLNITHRLARRYALE